MSSSRWKVPFLKLTVPIFLLTLLCETPVFSQSSLSVQEDVLSPQIKATRLFARKPYWVKLAQKHYPDIAARQAEIQKKLLELTEQRRGLEETLLLEGLQTSGDARTRLVKILDEIFRLKVAERALEIETLDKARAWFQGNREKWTSQELEKSLSRLQSLRQVNRDED